MLEFKPLATRAALRSQPEGDHEIRINVGIQTPRDSRSASVAARRRPRDPNQCRNSNTSRVARRFSCGMTNCRRNSNIDLKRPPPLLDAPGGAREPALSRSQRVVTREERVARRSHAEGVPEIQINVGIQTPRDSRSGSVAARRRPRDSNQCRNSNTSRVARRFSCGMTNCRRNSNIDLKRPPPPPRCAGRSARAGTLEIAARGHEGSRRVRRDHRWPCTITHGHARSPRATRDHLGQRGITARGVTGDHLGQRGITWGRGRGHSLGAAGQPTLLRCVGHGSMSSKVSTFWTMQEFLGTTTLAG